MREHRELTGVDFDDIMVFPQGHFSTTAMEALRSCGYLAAVNSTGRPWRGAGPQLRELLDVAITRYAGLPLFVRRHEMPIAKPLLVGGSAVAAERGIIVGSPSAGGTAGG